LDREVLLQLIDRDIKDLTLEEFAGLFINPVIAVDEFSKLCNDERCGNRISLLFNPHRLDTKGVQNNFSYTLYSGLQNEHYREGLARIWAHKYTQAKDDTFYWATQRGYNGIPAIAEFPPYVARKIYKKYGENNLDCLHVLDPCAGWGGRMIGCATIPNSTYVACEPSTKTFEGLCKLGEWLTILQPTFTYKIYHLPYEDCDLSKYDKFDIALTSPPYYDTETYSDEETNSCNRYTSYENWVEGFYEPFIKKTVSLISDDASFILNVGERKYPLAKSMYDICEKNEIFATEIDSYLVGRGEGREKFYLLSKKKKQLTTQKDLF
jgi:hypothetical protein